MLAYLSRETLNGICLNHVFVCLLTLVGAEFACGVLLACSANRVAKVFIINNLHFRLLRTLNFAAPILHLSRPNLAQLSGICLKLRSMKFRLISQ